MGWYEEIGRAMAATRQAVPISMSTQTIQGTSHEELAPSSMICLVATTRNYQ